MTPQEVELRGMIAEQVAIIHTASLQLEDLRAALIILEEVNDRLQHQESSDKIESWLDALTEDLA